MFSAKKYLEYLDLNKKESSLNYLNEIIYQHASRVVFNNIKVFNSPQIVLDLELNALFESCILGKKGGYCFELNKLFYYLLKELGFDVEFSMARVNYNKLGEFPRTHRLTYVTISGKRYLVDIGFGPYCPNKAIPINGEVVNCYGRKFRILEKEDCLGLEILRDDTFFSLYRFDLKSKFNEADFELSNYYTNTHPDSKFVKEIIISKIKGSQVEFINNKKYVFKDNSKDKIINIRTEAEFREYLSNFDLVDDVNFKIIKE